MVAVLYNTSKRARHPSTAAKCAVFLISLLWVFCAVATSRLDRWHKGEWGFKKMLAVSALAAVEAAVLFVIGAIHLGAVNSLWKLFVKMRDLFT